MVDQKTVTGGDLRGPKADVVAPESRHLELLVDLRDDAQPSRSAPKPWLTAEAALLNASRAQLRLKRMVDTSLAVVALLLLSPVMILAALAIGLSSKGPILYRQLRSGVDGAPFDFYKFRSMEVNADYQKPELVELNEASGPVFKIRDDPRTTAIGRVMRKFSIDELPQLWSVLRGDMSLVGPRPLPVEEAAECSIWEAQRLGVKPGITGIWQVSGRSELDFETWVRMDIEYIENWSFWLDLTLLARTIPAVLSGRGAY